MIDSLAEYLVHLGGQGRQGGVLPWEGMDQRREGRWSSALSLEVRAWLVAIEPASKQARRKHFFSHPRKQASAHVYTPLHAVQSPVLDPPAPAPHTIVCVDSICSTRVLPDRGRPTTKIGVSSI